MPHYQPTDAVLIQRIRELFEVGPGAAGWRMTTDEVLEQLRGSGFQLGDNDRAQEMQLSKVLNTLGVQRTRSATWRGYLNIRPK